MNTGFEKEDLFLKYIKNEKQDKKNNYGFEMSLHKKLNIMCHGFTYDEYVKIRSSRDWESFDKLSPVEKLQERIREIQEYKSY